MAEHNDTGKTGEKIAVDHLKSKGFEILETNWRFGNDELDIIAQNDIYVVFVEVKTRTSNYFGEPEAFVNKTKQKFIIRAAEAYITQNNIDLEARFDIVSVLLGNASPRVNHIEDAFYPLLRK